jgi:pyruvate dehydrogenase E1 component
VIVQNGLRRMYQEDEDVFYYLALYNENYAQPSMPEGAEEGIIKGIYKLRAGDGKPKAHLWGSGPMINEALRAQRILAEQYNVQTDVWSLTSYNELRRDALRVERWNRLHPAEAERLPYIVQVMRETEGPIIASTDYMKIVPDQVAPWLNGRLVSLGTDGFGRSDSREYLRGHFEIDAESIVAATLSRLAREGKYNAAKATQAMIDLGLRTEAVDPSEA